MKRVFFITGDYSGDMHASAVVRALRQIDETMHIAGVGGETLASAGVYLIQPPMESASFSPAQYVGGLSRHYRLGKTILKFLSQFEPDAVVLVDYGGFNLWMARRLKQAGYRVFYYIPPQIWASRPWRIRSMLGAVERVFCIFPFEVELYRRHGIPVTYVGHPLVAQLPPPANREDFCRQYGLDAHRPIVGLFPGSRKLELNYLLAPMLAALPLIESAYRLQFGVSPQFAICPALSLSKDFFDQALAEAESSSGPLPSVTQIADNHALLSVSNVAIAASGTVTLEAALYKTPTVILYRMNPLMFAIAKPFILTAHIGLPNLLLGPQSAILPELLQEAVTPAKIAEAALPFLDPESAAHTQALAGFQTIAQLLGTDNAAAQVASGLVQALLNTSSVAVATR
ncbi:MAG: lipid-A-disaccharide synthase [Candidatus Melainabacteria bacterium]|nr:lipid-A-disaccharide synthase [Candidatus Melainabacteria bacterium]